MDYGQHHDETYKKHDKKPSEEYGHGWIQWKGTDVCIDLHCKCGHHGHFDGDFMYYYECPKCKQLYAVGQVVTLIPLNKENTEFVKQDRPGLIKTAEEEMV